MPSSSFYYAVAAFKRLAAASTLTAAVSPTLIDTVSVSRSLDTASPRQSSEKSIAESSEASSSGSLSASIVKDATVKQEQSIVEEEKDAAAPNEANYESPDDDKDGVVALPKETEIWNEEVARIENEEEALKVEAITPQDDMSKPKDESEALQSCSEDVAQPENDQVRRSKEEIEALRKELEMAKGEAASHGRESKKWRVYGVRLEREIGTLRKRTVALQSNLDGSNDEVGRLRKELEATKSEAVVQSREAKARGEEESERLRKDLETLHTQSKDSRDEMVVLRGDLTVAKDQVAVQEREIESLKETLGSTRATAAVQETELNKSKADNARMEADNELLRGQVEALQTDLNHSLDMTETLRVELENAKDQNATQERDLETSRREVETLQNELEVTKGELAAHEQELENWKTRRAQAEEEGDNLRKQVEVLQDDVKKSNDEVLVLRSDLENSERRKGAIWFDLQQLQQRSKRETELLKRACERQLEDMRGRIRQSFGGSVIQWYTGINL